MLAFFIRTAISAVALLVIASVSGGQIEVRNFTAALIAAIVLGLANAVVKPVLYGIAKAMTCALSCLTLGLWSLFLSWLVSGFLFWLTAKHLPGFHIKDYSFWVAMWGALALSVVNALATVLITSGDDADRRK